MQTPPLSAAEPAGGPAAATLVPCPLCASLDRQPFADDRGHEFTRCVSCGFVYIPDRAVRSGMRDVYTADSQTGEGVVRAYAYSRVGPYAHALRLVRRLCPGGGHLLDVGCRYGLFTAQARDAGYDAAGIEIARDEAEYARRVMGCAVYEQPLDELGIPAGSQDVVILLDVIEHLDEPLPHLLAAARVLKPGGAIVVRVPNLCLHALKMRALVRLLGPGRARLMARKAGIMGLQAPSHMNWFTAETLQRALASAGFGDVCLRLGPPELALPTRVRTRVANALKSGICAFAQLLYWSTRVPLTTLVATARKPAEAAAPPRAPHH